MTNAHLWTSIRRRGSGVALTGRWEAACAGAEVWAAYGAVETVIAVLFQRLYFPDSYVRPSAQFTLFLLAFYPAVGWVLGMVAARVATAFGTTISAPAAARVQVTCLTLLFLCNTLPMPEYSRLFAAAVSVVVVGAAIRSTAAIANAWTVSLLLLVPLWIVKDVAERHSTTWKAFMAVGVMVVVVVSSHTVSKLAPRVGSGGRVGPLLGRCAFAVASLAALLTFIPQPVDRLGVAQPRRESLPNVVLVVLDTVRADHLSVYGYGRRTSPHLEALARHATVYQRAYAPSNATLPSHASLFTGLWPSVHGAHADNGGWRELDASTVTLAQRLTERGYATISIAANYNFLSHGFGLDRGFQYVDARPPEWTPFGNPPPYTLRAGLARLIDWSGGFSREHLLKRTASEVTDAGIAMVERLRQQSRPFLLFLNYMDAHSLCIPPEPFASMFPEQRRDLPLGLFNQRLEAFHGGVPARVPAGERQFFLAQYDRAIAYEDAEIGRLVQALGDRGLGSNTMIIVTSDHGETFGERGIIGHGTSTYDDQTRVPLIVKLPGQSASSLVKEPTTTMMVHDWILAAAGLGEVREAQPVVAEAFPFDVPPAMQPLVRGGRAIIEGRYKLITKTSSQPELYDLVDDPLEEHDLASSPAGLAMRAPLEARLQRWLDERPARLAQTRPRQLDTQAEKRLRSLGYIR